jgi:hypothetical protein
MSLTIPELAAELDAKIGEVLADQVQPNFKSSHGGKKKATTRAERMHLNEAAKQCCVITGRSDNIVLHHPYHDRQTRYFGKKAPHFEVIAVWQGIHQGLLGHKEIRLHGEKQQWRELHGPDWSHVPAMRMAIYGDALITDEEINEYWSQEQPPRQHA